MDDAPKVVLFAIVISISVVLMVTLFINLTY